MLIFLRIFCIFSARKLQDHGIFQYFALHFRDSTNRPNYYDCNPANTTSVASLHNSKILQKYPKRKSSAKRTGNERKRPQPKRRPSPELLRGTVFYSQARHMQTHVSCVGSSGGHIKTADDIVTLSKANAPVKERSGIAVQTAFITEFRRKSAFF